MASTQVSREFSASLSLTRSSASPEGTQRRLFDGFDDEDIFLHATSTTAAAASRTPIPKLTAVVSPSCGSTSSAGMSRVLHGGSSTPVMSTTGGTTPRGPLRLSEDKENMIVLSTAAAESAATRTFERTVVEPTTCHPSSPSDPHVVVVVDIRSTPSASPQRRPRTSGRGTVVDKPRTTKRVRESRSLHPTATHAPPRRSRTTPTAALTSPSRPGTHGRSGAGPSGHPASSSSSRLPLPPPAQPTRLCRLHSSRGPLTAFSRTASAASLSQKPTAAVTSPAVRNRNRLASSPSGALTFASLVPARGGRPPVGPRADVGTHASTTKKRTGAAQPFRRAATATDGVGALHGPRRFARTQSSSAAPTDSLPPPRRPAAAHEAPRATKGAVTRNGVAPAPPPPPQRFARASTDTRTVRHTTTTTMTTCAKSADGSAAPAAQRGPSAAATRQGSTRGAAKKTAGTTQTTTTTTATTRAARAPVSRPASRDSRRPPSPPVRSASTAAADAATNPTRVPSRRPPSPSSRLRADSAGAAPARVPARKGSGAPPPPSLKLGGGAGGRRGSTSALAMAGPVPVAVAPARGRRGASAHARPFTTTSTTTTVRPSSPQDRAKTRTKALLPPSQARDAALGTASHGTRRTASASAATEKASGASAKAGRAPRRTASAGPAATASFTLPSPPHKMSHARSGSAGRRLTHAMAGSSPSSSPLLAGLKTAAPSPGGAARRRPSLQAGAEVRKTESDPYTLPAPPVAAHTDPSVRATTSVVVSPPSSQSPSPDPVVAVSRSEGVNGTEAGASVPVVAVAVEGEGCVPEAEGNGGDEACRVAADASPSPVRPVEAAGDATVHVPWLHLDKLEAACTPRRRGSSEDDDDDDDDALQDELGHGGYYEEFHRCDDGSVLGGLRGPSDGGGDGPVGSTERGAERATQASHPLLKLRLARERAAQTAAARALQQRAASVSKSRETDGDEV